MTYQTDKKLTYINLDFVRGISALMVLFSHARSYTIIPPGALENSPGIVDKLFYFATGFGHQAVMVFFVLSGFFISRSILNLLARNNWTWRRYLISRMSRLWAVLLPALLLTALWDHLGIFLGGAEFYAGEIWRQYGSIPGGGEGGVNLTLGNFVQNALFLVGITTPDKFGSNGPLWSLTYEFWYYMIFPVAYLLFMPVTSRPAKIILLSLLILMLWILPFKILYLGLVWLMGYIVLVLSPKAWVQRYCGNWLYFAASLLLFLAMLSLTRADIISNRLIGDIVVGLGFSFFMLALICHHPESTIYVGVSRFISKISYSLYLVHFPFLAFIATIFLNNQQFPPQFFGIGLFAGLCLLSVVYASIVYWLFERNTHVVANYLKKLAGLEPTTASKKV